MIDVEEGKLFSQNYTANHWQNLCQKNDIYFSLVNSFLLGYHFSMIRVVQ